MALLIILVVLLGLIAGLGAVLVVAQRQYDPADQLARADPPPMPPERYASLAAAVAATIEQAGRPRNGAEIEAIAALRTALDHALDGEHASEVRAAIDRIDGVVARHDVRFRRRPGRHDADPTARSTGVDHLVVGQPAVFVVDSKAKADRGSCEELAAKVDIVRDLLAPIPAQGVLVLQDVLALPDRLREGPVIMDGVLVATSGQLPAVVTAAGPIADLELVAAQIDAAFEPALPPEEARIKVG